MRLLPHSRSRTNLRSTSPQPPASSSSHSPPETPPPPPLPVPQSLPITGPPLYSTPVTAPPKVSTSTNGSSNGSGGRGLLRSISGLFKPKKKRPSKLQGIGHSASAGSQRARAFSFDSESSREPSLDIRPPSGLGSFGSLPNSPATSPRISSHISAVPSSHVLPAMSEIAEGQEEDWRAMRRRRSESDLLSRVGTSSVSAWPVPPGHERFATESEIEHSRIEAARLPPSPELERAPKEKQTQGPFKLGELPHEVLVRVLNMLEKTEVASSLGVSKMVCEAGRDSLYRALDLRHLSHLDPRRSEKVLHLLGTRRDLASRVRWLSLPSSSPISPIDSDRNISATLRNCTNLTSLVTSSLGPLSSSTFHLRRLTLLSTLLSSADFRDLWTLLSARPLLTHLSLPRLHMAPDASIIEDDIPPNLLPALRDASGPPTLLQALVPGRPVRVARVYLDSECTIHQGLKPAALAAALSRSTEKVGSFGVRAASEVDGRTIERILGAVGLELGSSVRNIEVVCALPEEVGLSP